MLYLSPTPQCPTKGMWVGLGNLHFEEPQGWLSSCVTGGVASCSPQLLQRGVDLDGMLSWGQASELPFHRSLGLWRIFLLRARGASSSW